MDDMVTYFYYPQGMMFRSIDFSSVHISRRHPLHLFMRSSHYLLTVYVYGNRQR